MVTNSRKALFEVVTQNHERQLFERRNINDGIAPLITLAAAIGALLLPSVLDGSLLDTALQTRHGYLNLSDSISAVTLLASGATWIIFVFTIIFMSTGHKIFVAEPQLDLIDSLERTKQKLIESAELSGRSLDQVDEVLSEQLVADHVALMAAGADIERKSNLSRYALRRAAIFFGAACLVLIVMHSISNRMP